MTSRREFLKAGLAASALPVAARAAFAAGLVRGHGAALQGSLRHAVRRQRRVRAACRGSRPRRPRDGRRHDAFLVRRSLPSLAARSRPRSPGSRPTARCFVSSGSRGTNACASYFAASTRSRRTAASRIVSKDRRHCCRRPPLTPRPTMAWAAALADVVAECPRDRVRARIGKRTDVDAAHAAGVRNAVLVGDCARAACMRSAR